MTDLDQTLTRPRGRSLFAPDARTARRNRAEARFRAFGVAATAAGVLFLGVLLLSILWNGAGAFQQTFITTSVTLDPAKLDKQGERRIEDIKKVSTFAYAPLVQGALLDQVGAHGIQVVVVVTSSLVIRCALYFALLRKPYPYRYLLLEYYTE